MKKILSVLWRKVKKFIKLPLGKKLLLAEAFVMLGAGRLSVLVYPFGKIKMKVERNIEKQKNRTSLSGWPDAPKDDESSRRLDDIYGVKWAVAVISRYTPWKSNCFAQALAAHYMLDRRGMVTSMHFGVAKTGTEELAAHAWLKCNDIVVTGEKGKDRFSTVLDIGS